MAGPKLRGGRRMDLLGKQSSSKHKWQFQQQDWTLTHWSVSIRWVIQNGYRWTIQDRKKNSRLINLINNSSNYDIELFSRRFTSAQVVFSCVYTFAKQQRQFTKDPNQICLTIEPTYSSTAELHFTSTIEVQVGTVVGRSINLPE